MTSRGPWVAAETTCHICGFEWVAIYRDGAGSLECPHGIQIHSPREDV